MQRIDLNNTRHSLLYILYLYLLNILFFCALCGHVGSFGRTPLIMQAIVCDRAAFYERLCLRFENYYVIN